MDLDWRYQFPIENGDFPASYVTLPEGRSNFSIENTWNFEAMTRLFWLEGEFNSQVPG